MEIFSQWICPHALQFYLKWSPRVSVPGPHTATERSPAHIIFCSHDDWLRSLRRGPGRGGAHSGLLALIRHVRAAHPLPRPLQDLPQRGLRRVQEHRHQGRGPPRHPSRAGLPRHLLRSHHSDKERREGGEAAAAAAGDGLAVPGGDVRAGHLAVLHAPAAAREQVFVQARPREAPQADRDVPVRRAVQPPGGGLRPRHRRRDPDLPRLRHDPQDLHLLLHLLYRQRGGGPHRALHPLEPAPLFLREQQRVAQHPPPALRPEVQLRHPVLRVLGQAVRDQDGVRGPEEDGRWWRVRDQGPQ